MIMSGRCRGADVGTLKRSAGCSASDRCVQTSCSARLQPTRQTWEYAKAGGASAGDIQYLHEIYRAWVPELLTMIRDVPDEIHTLLVLGHAPGIPDLVEHLCVRTDSPDWAQMDSKFPTSALAVVNVPGPWAELGKGRAELASFVVPRG